MNEILQCGSNTRNQLCKMFCSSETRMRALLVFIAMLDALMCTFTMCSSRQCKPTELGVTLKMSTESRGMLHMHQIITMSIWTMLEKSMHKRSIFSGEIQIAVKMCGESTYTETGRMSTMRALFAVSIRFVFGSLLCTCRTTICGI